MDSKKNGTPTKQQQQRRLLSVVGGTDSAPSLREVRRHRNTQTKGRSISMKPSIKCPLGDKKTNSSSDNVKSDGATQKMKACDLCSKIQRQWKESNGLRKKTTYSDVTLHSSDGEYYYCNSFILSVWSKSLLDKAQCLKGKNGEEEWIVNVDVFSGEILNSCLRFIYGGVINDLPPRHLLEIVNMADTYQMEDVKRSCFMAAERAQLKIDNVVAMWVFADQHNLSEAVCRSMRFIYANLEKVVKDHDWTRVSHRPEMLLNLFHSSAEWTTPDNDWRSYAQSDQTPSSFSMGVDHIWRQSNDLREPTAFTDATIVTKGGRCFHVHTQIIYASSPTFATFLREEAGPGDHIEVIMDDMDDDVVEEFLRFLYRQEPSKNFRNVAELVNVLASNYEVRELAELCEREMAGQTLNTVPHALQMLREAEEHRMPAAKSVCFRFLYNNLDALRDNVDWNHLIADEPQLLTEMMLESKRSRRMIE